MPGVKIVTDSAGDFAPEFMERYGITVVPLTVHFGEESFRDAYEIRGKAFYDKLTTSQYLARTSQPSPAAFEEVFRNLTGDGSAVVAVILSSGVSGTYQSAAIARDALADRKILVVDSKQASAGEGLMALAAAELAATGATAEDVAEAVARMGSQMVTLFSVDTLEYLAKNGRIGKAQHFMGTLLNMKPILGLDKEGTVSAVERVRGKGKVIPRLMELSVERLPSKNLSMAGISHAMCPEEAAKLKEAIMSTFQVSKFFESEIGAVIGTHVGPGTMAMFLVP